MGHRNALILLSLLCVAGMSLGSMQLVFNGNYRIFFSDDNPQLVAFETIEKNYTSTDNLIYVVAARDGEIFSPSSFNSIRKLTAEGWDTPFVLRVDSITNYQHIHADGDELIVNDLVDEQLSLTPQVLAQLKQISFSDPVLLNNIVSSKGHVSLINISLDLPKHDEGLNEALFKTINNARAVRDRFEAENPNLKLYILGIAAINNAFIELAIDDMSFLIPLMLVVIFGLLIFMIGSLSGTLVTILIVTTSVMVAMGATGFMGYELNQVNIGMPLIVLSLGVCDCVHILNNYLYNVRQGAEKLDAMKNSLKINIYPLFLTSLTTVIGFLGMNFSESPSFRELGNMCTAGIVAAFVLSITLFPGLVVLFPVKNASRQIHFEGCIAWVCEFVIKHRKTVFWTSLSFSILIVIAMFRNDLNDTIIKYFSKSVPLRIAAEFVDQNITGVDDIFYSLDSGKPDGINDPEFLRKVDEFAAWYLSQPEVVHVSSYTHIMKQLNRALHGDQPEYYRLPESKALAAQYLLLYEMSLADGLGSENIINADKSAVRFSARMKMSTAKQILAVEQRANRWLEEHYPELASRGSSISIMFSHLGQKNIYAMFYGSLLALVLVSITLLIALRSVRYGLISILPNSLPAATAMGFWGLFNGQVTLAVAVVFTMTLGIIVDDTVHFLTKYIHARRHKGKSAEDAIRYAFTIVGKALITTTVILVSGFLVMAQSDFNVNGHTSLMAALTIFIALCFDLLLLPAFLLLFDNEKAVEEMALRDVKTLSADSVLPSS